MFLWQIKGMIESEIVCGGSEFRNIVIYSKFDTQNETIFERANLDSFSKFAIQFAIRSLRIANFVLRISQKFGLASAEQADIIVERFFKLNYCYSVVSERANSRQTNIRLRPISLQFKALQIFARSKQLGHSRMSLLNGE